MKCKELAAKSRKYPEVVSLDEVIRVKQTKIMFYGSNSGVMIL